VDRRFGNWVSDGRTIILSRYYSPIRTFSSFSSNSRIYARGDDVANEQGLSRSLAFPTVYDLAAIDS